MALEAQNGECELLGQSMLRMIRSARHRLQCDASGGKGTWQEGFGSEVAPRVLPGHARPCRMYSRGSENALPTPIPPASCSKSLRPAVLGDVTNVTNFAQKGDAICTKPILPEHPPQPPASAPVPLLPQAKEPSVEVVQAECDPETEEEQQEDPQRVSEYVTDIYFQLQQQEGDQLPEPGYMEKQAQVTSRMRAILADWLVDVHKKYKLQQNTLFLAVGILDRFLERRNTLRRHLQLVGVTALLIASKFEELYPPQINDFVYVTDKAYSKEEVMRMEISILTVLEFRICTPTAVHFLDRYQAVNGCGDTHRELAQYLLELTLVEYRMLKYPPSHLAAAAVLLSNKLLRRQPAWPSAAVKHTRMTEQVLRDCGREMCALLEHAENNPLQAVRKKYSQAKHMGVAKMSFAGLPPALPPPPPPAVAQAAAVPPSHVSSGEEAANGAPGPQAKPARPTTARKGSPAGASTDTTAAPDCSQTLVNKGAWSPVETVCV